MKLPTNYKAYSRYYQAIGPLFKKPRVRAYTMLILSFFTMSFFGIFAIKPTLKTIARLKRQIDDSQLVNESLEKKIISLAKLEEEHKKIEKDLSLISSALPSEAKFSSFLEDLERLAQEVGATISGAKLSSIDLSGKGDQSPSKISASLTLAGDYSSGKDYLDRLLNTSRIYTVDRFEIQSDSKEETAIKLDLSINTYYLKL